MRIRKYQEADCEAIIALFIHTVHTVNAADYTQEQLDAWAPQKIDRERWNPSFLAHDSWVAEENGEIIGFGDIASDGYLDRLYVSADHQRKGVATALLKQLEATAKDKIITHASITAKPFFEKRGYRVLKEQQVERKGVLLTNFVMEKKR